MTIAIYKLWKMEEMNKVAARKKRNKFAARNKRNKFAARNKRNTFAGKVGVVVVVLVVFEVILETYLWEMEERNEFAARKKRKINSRRK